MVRGEFAGQVVLVVAFGVDRFHPQRIHQFSRGGDLRSRQVRVRRFLHGHHHGNGAKTVADDYRDALLRGLVQKAVK